MGGRDMAADDGLHKYKNRCTDTGCVFGWRCIDCQLSVCLEELDESVSNARRIALAAMATGGLAELDKALRALSLIKRFEGNSLMSYRQ